MKELKLVSLKGEERSKISITKEITLGEGFTIIAGPHRVEEEKKFLELALELKNKGADILRGDAFKWEDTLSLGLKGLQILEKARRETGMPVITEVTDPRDVSWAAEYADILLIGSPNMYNFSLMQEAGRSGKPIILMRGANATLHEWLNSGEFILKEGNSQLILCEKGVRTYETYTNNTLDISAVPSLRELTHLPIIVDPCQGTGRRSLILPMSLASVASGAHGLMLEVHRTPSENSGEVSLEQFCKIIKKIKLLKEFFQDWGDHFQGEMV